MPLNQEQVDLIEQLIEIKIWQLFNSKESLAAQSGHASDNELNARVSLIKEALQRV